MNEENTLLLHVAITSSLKLNNRVYLPVIEGCGGVEGFFRETERGIRALYAEHGVDPVNLAREDWTRQAARELAFMQREGVRCSYIDSPRYPRLLKHCADAPLVIFHKGTLEPTDAKMLAIVGTRKASERCKARVELFVKQIVEMHYAPVVVSGLAYGIDVSAHQSAMRHDLVTWAVLGHGLHTLYPAPHRSIAEKIIAAGGCLISEYPSSAPILPANFLQRNRIIAGISEAVLVAESAVRGGAMSTARQAFSYNRGVMAIPGRPDDHLSSGCNMLIKGNIAHLVEETADVLHVLGWEERASRQVAVPLDLFTEPEREERVKTILREQGDQHVDQLCLLAAIPLPELTPLLLKLELEGSIVPLPGNRYALS
ncbi:MAG: DNA-processing protein DprA [Odoribacteraceae bacterium]|jgi:DNA processing protein|nr:DNA-processing protein DprA [Odoribacteraceae bacterium]